MRVYRISGDPDFITARCSDLQRDDILRKASRDGTMIDRRMSIGMEYAFRLPENEGVVTDCPYMSANNGLLLSSRAVGVLHPLLDESGALLTVSPQLDMGYQLFFCTTRIDALDTENTELCDQELFMPWDIRRYAFYPDALQEAGFFQVNGLFNCLFATDRVIRAMAGHRLTGFRIRPVWSSETGPLATLEGSGAEFIRFPPGFGTTLSEKRQVMRDYIAGRR